MIIEKDGKFFEKVEVEKEISELEYLRRKIKELEEKVSGLEARPDYISYVHHFDAQCGASNSSTI